MRTEASAAFGQLLTVFRKHLGLTQSQLGTIGGVSKTTQYLYEIGERQPDAVYLMKVMRCGIDVVSIFRWIDWYLEARYENASPDDSPFNPDHGPVYMVPFSDLPPKAINAKLISYAAKKKTRIAEVVCRARARGTPMTVDELALCHCIANDIYAPYPMEVAGAQEAP